MPILNRLKCWLELSDGEGGHTELQEISTAYGDGVVNTFTPVPSGSGAFCIKITSDGYIAGGLAAFVFIDGDYQCNRLRRGLQPFTPGSSEKKTNVSFIMRQKEEHGRRALAAGGNIIGREWSFGKLQIDSLDALTNSPRVADASGTISVIVLRCLDHNSTSAPSSGFVTFKPKPSSIQAPPSEPKEKEDDIGGLFGLFDGPSDGPSPLYEPRHNLYYRYLPNDVRRADLRAGDARGSDDRWSDRNHSHHYYANDWTSRAHNPSPLQTRPSDHRSQPQRSTGYQPSRVLPRELGSDPVQISQDHNQEPAPSFSFDSPVASDVRPRPLRGWNNDREERHQRHRERDQVAESNWSPDIPGAWPRRTPLRHSQEASGWGISNNQDDRTDAQPRARYHEKERRVDSLSERGWTTEPSRTLEKGWGVDISQSHRKNQGKSRSRRIRNRPKLGDVYGGSRESRQENGWENHRRSGKGGWSFRLDDDEKRVGWGSSDDDTSNNNMSDSLRRGKGKKSGAAKGIDRDLYHSNLYSDESSDHKYRSTRRKRSPINKRSRSRSRGRKSQYISEKDGRNQSRSFSESTPESRARNRNNTDKRLREKKYRRHRHGRKRNSSCENEHHSHQQASPKHRNKRGESKGWGIASDSEDHSKDKEKDKGRSSGSSKSSSNGSGMRKKDSQNKDNDQKPERSSQPGTPKNLNSTAIASARSTNANQPVSDSEKLERKSDGWGNENGNGSQNNGGWGSGSQNNKKDKQQNQGWDSPKENGSNTLDVWGQPEQEKPAEEWGSNEAKGSNRGAKSRTDGGWGSGSKAPTNKAKSTSGSRHGKGKSPRNPVPPRRGHSLSQPFLHFPDVPLTALRNYPRHISQAATSLGHGCNLDKSKAPLCQIPEQAAKSKKLDRQAYAGPETAYFHKISDSTPTYIDTLEKPYAKFVFHYRSRKALEKLLGRPIKETAEEYKHRIHNMPREDLIKQAMKNWENKREEMPDAVSGISLRTVQTKASKMSQATSKQSSFHGYGGSENKKSVAEWTEKVGQASKGSSKNNRSKGGKSGSKGADDWGSSNTKGASVLGGAGENTGSDWKTDNKEGEQNNPGDWNAADDNNRSGGENAPAAWDPAVDNTGGGDAGW